jgi:endo-alpha-N-acetylgalactosaminidase
MRLVNTGFPKSFRLKALIVAILFIAANIFGAHIPAIEQFLRDAVYAEEPDYSQDFNDGTVGDWNLAAGEAELSSELVSEDNYALKVDLEAEKNFIIISEDAPILQDAEYEATFRITGPEAARIGFIFRYMDENNWSAIQYDTDGSWNWNNMVNGTETNGKILSGVTINKDQDYKIRIKYIGQNIEIYLNDSKIYSCVLPGVSLRAGKIGFRGWWSAKTVYLDDINYTFQSFPEDYAIYTQDFSDGTLGDWELKDGAATITSGEISSDNNALKINTNEYDRPIIIANDSPYIQDGQYTATFKLTTETSGIGFIFRYVDNSNWTAIQHDADGTWVWANMDQGVEKYGTLFSNKKLNLNQTYTISIRYEGTNVEVYLDGEKVRASNISQLTLRAGKIGFRCWYMPKELYLDDIQSIGKALVGDPEIKSYVQKFDNGLEDWQIVNDVETDLSIAEIGENDYALMAVTEDLETPMIIATESPKLQDAVYEATLKISGDVSRVGFVFRYIDNNNWSAIQYNNGENDGSWTWSNLTDGNETWGIITKSTKLSADTEYRIKIRYVGNLIEIYVDDNKIYGSVIPQLPLGRGKIGIRSWYTAKTIYLDDIRYYTQMPPLHADFDEVTLESDFMDVILDDTFPRVMRYEIKDGQDSVVEGQKDYISSVEINNSLFWPDRVSFEQNGNKAQYLLEFDAIETRMTVEFELQDNVLGMRITDIEEYGDFKVKTIEFPNHSLIFISINDADAAEASLWTDAGYGGNIWEAFYLLKDDEGAIPDQTRHRTYAFLNNDKYAATIVNNVIDETAKINLKSDGKGGSMWNGEWIYRGPDNVTEELPWCKVIICGDENNDGTVDWQDGAIGYRKNMVIPYGGEYIKDYYSYISYNISSLAQSPFLRALDNAKKLYYYTDGFGQMILCKGYQAEGHDDSHPDYGGHIGIRQGGKEDFNTLIEKGKEYNIKVGVHINATEYHADAFEVDDDVLVKPYEKAWYWLDQAYLVDKTKDITSGELYRRLDMLKEDAPGLSWVYVDVYEGAGWEAYKLYNKLNSNGWLVGTEYSGPMIEGVAWVHKGTDTRYEPKGNTSRIMRFIKNHVQDTFESNSLLKGLKLPKAGGWGEYHSIWEGVETFYNHNLPTKYMQYFPIIRWTDNRVDFEGNVCSVLEDNMVNIYKDGKKIATCNNSGNEVSKNSLIFIPWDPVNEEKIYHWNPSGGETTWDLPNSWAGTQTVKLYRLTDTGRVYVEDIEVVDGKVTINALAKTPYILYKHDTVAPSDKETNWGEGGFVKDPGFDSRSFEIWNKASTAGDTSHISIKEETSDTAERRAGNTYLEIKGNNGADAVVSQQITGLKPGKIYTASVYVKTSSGRRASIGVKDYGGPEVTNWVDRTDIKQYGEATKYYEDYYQHLKVVFDVPAGSTNALLYLKAEQGSADSFVEFDDVRVWENPGKTPVPDGCVLYEDFENVDQGWGPFVLAGNYSVRTHLSERKEGSKQIQHFVINGNFSLKINMDDRETGELLKTQQSTLKLEPNTTYRLSFKYRYDKNLHETSIPNNLYSIAVKTRDGGNQKLFEHTLSNSENYFSKVFTTGDYNDYYLAINKLKTGVGIMILDDILIEANPESHRIEATYNEEQGLAVVSGSTVEGEGHAITITVTDEGGEVVYSGQGTTLENGSIYFEFPLEASDEEKTYTIRVSGEGIEAETTLTVPASQGEDPGEPGDEPDDEPGEEPGDPEGGKDDKKDDKKKPKDKEELQPGQVTVSGNTLTVTPKVDEESSQAQIAINLGQIEQALSEAQEDDQGLTTVVINVDSSQEFNSLKMELPLEALSLQQQNRQFVVNTPFGSIVIPANLIVLQPETENATITIILTLSQGTDPDMNNPEGLVASLGSELLSAADNTNNGIVLHLDIRINGEPAVWNTAASPVNVSVSYEPGPSELENLEFITVKRINEDGSLSPVPSGRFNADTKHITFKAKGPGAYSIVFERKTFDDTDSVPWAKHFIEVMASKGIIYGTSNSTYSPVDKITRGDFIALLVRVLELTAETDSNFDDVKPKDHFYNEIAIARKLNIASGYGDNTFRPRDYITRQDMMALVERALKATGKIDLKALADLSQYTDSDQISGYARRSVELLVGNGIIVGHENRINPYGVTTRAEAAVIIYKLYYK